MKLKSATIIFIVISIIFISICLFDIVEGNENMGISGKISITPTSLDDDNNDDKDKGVDEEITTSDNMKLLDGRIFYSQSKDNDDYIIASINKETGYETLILTMKHSFGSDTEIYGNPIIAQNELGNTKEYSTKGSTSRIQLIIQGGEATALRLYKNGQRFFTSNQYKHYDDLHTTNNDHTTNYSSNPNYILKSKVVPPVQTRNPYLINDQDNWTKNNNLLPNENDSNNTKKKEQNLLDKIKSLLETKTKTKSESETKPLTKYEEVYRNTHGIPKYEVKSDNIRCPPCAPCGRCPDSAFQCKYNQSNRDLPRPVLNSFSTFGM